MKTNLKKQTVLSKAIPAGSAQGLQEINFPEYESKSVKTKRPFKILINDKVLTENDKVRLFNEYYFAYGGFYHKWKIVVLKLAESNKIVLLIREKLEKKEAKFKLFSVMGISSFDTVEQLLVPSTNYYNGNYDFHLVFNTKNTMKIVRFSTTENGRDFESIKTELLSGDVSIHSIFGPFPLDLEIKSSKFDSRYLSDALWLAFCSDAGYRFFYTVGQRLIWIHDLEAAPLVLKYFLPTFKANYFVCVTETQVLAVLLAKGTCNQTTFTQALKGRSRHRLLDPERAAFSEKISFFLGQYHDQGFFFMRGQRPGTEKLPEIRDFTKHLIHRKL